MNQNSLYKSKSESGQIIVVMAFLMIAMIAMLGLAIDGGGLMLLNRDVQNAGDAAIVAGTYAICSGGNNTQIIDAARTAAKDQGFVHGVDGVTVDVDPNFTPPGGAVAGVQYVEVEINAPKESYFIHIVYTGALNVNTSSVGRCNQPSSSTEPYFDYTDHAMVALGSTCSWDVNATGSSMTFDGSIYSNGNLKVNGSGGGSVTINGTVTYTGDLNSNGMTINPASSPVDTNNPLPLSAFPPLFDINDYVPSSAKAIAAGSDYHYYASGHTFKNETMEGLYYVDGDVTMNKISVGAKGITVVMTGSLSMQNNVKNQDFKPYIDTLNFFTTQTNHNCNSSSGLKVAGSSNVFSGIFYGPDTTVQMSGSNNQACALIGYYVNPSSSSSSWGGTCNWTPPPPPPSDPPTIGIAQ